MSASMIFGAYDYIAHSNRPALLAAAAVAGVVWASSGAGLAFGVAAAGVTVARWIGHRGAPTAPCADDVKAVYNSVERPVRVYIRANRMAANRFLGKYL